MKIAIEDKVKREVEVTLPIYRRQGLDSCEIYSLIREKGDGRLQEISITIADNEREAEIEIDDNYHFSSASSEDYNLGKGFYASSPSDFLIAWRKAKALVEER